MKKKLFYILLTIFIIFTITGLLLINPSSQIPAFRAGSSNGANPSENVFETVMPEPLLKESDHTVTMMIYMIGSDLESKTGAATNDMVEMINSGMDTSKAELYLYTGGSEEWFSDISSDTNSVYKLENGTFNLVESYTQHSMGDSECLSEFLNYVYSNSKTDSYNLILWDHGNGPVIGYGKDRLHDGDSLTLPEIRTALTNSPFNEDNKLGFIGFDACLMSSVELACVLAEYADILVASQEVEPNYGWNYAFLDKCGYISDASLAQYAAYNYMSYCNDYFSTHENFSNEVTMACIDLAYASELENAVDELFLKASNDVSGQYKTLVTERFNTRALGRATTGSEYDLVDTNSLMSYMEDSYPKQAKKVSSILDKMVIYSTYNTIDCCGLSMYYPYFNKNHYSKTWRENYASLGILDSYQEYLHRYEQIWLGTDMQAYFTEALTPEEYTPGIFSLQLNDDQLKRYLSSGYTILEKVTDGLYRPIAYSNDVALEGNHITAQYDGKALMLSDDYDQKFIVQTEVTDIIGDEIYYTITGTVSTAALWYAYSSSVSNSEIQLKVNTTTDKVEVLGMYLLDNDSSKADDMISGKKEPIDTDIWTSFSLNFNQPSYVTRKNGVILPYSEWTKGAWQFAHFPCFKNGFHFTYENLYDNEHEYYLMFDVIDVQGSHYSSELMPITLAKAPEKEEKIIPMEELFWTNGSTSPIAHYDNIDVSLVSSLDPSRNIPIYAIRVENKSGKLIIFNTSSIIINEILNSDCYIKDHAIADNETFYCTIDDCLNQLTLGKQPRLDSIEFNFYIDDYYTGEHLVTSKKLKWIITASPSTDIVCFPSFNNSASTQVIFENANLRITLLNFGLLLIPSDITYPSKTYLSSLLDCSFNLKIENLSSDVQDIVFNGVKMNDIFVDSTSNISLQPASEMYYLYTPSNGITPINMFYSDFLNSLELCIQPVSSESDIEYCPIILSEENLATNHTTTNTLYEDDKVIIADMGVYYSKASTQYYQELAITNKTDDSLVVKMEDYVCGDEYFYYRSASSEIHSTIIPHETCGAFITKVGGLPDEDVNVTFSIRTPGDYLNETTTPKINLSGWKGDIYEK